MADESHVFPLSVMELCRQRIMGPGCGRKIQPAVCNTFSDRNAWLILSFPAGLENGFDFSHNVCIHGHSYMFLPEPAAGTAARPRVFLCGKLVCIFHLDCYRYK